MAVVITLDKKRFKIFQNINPGTIAAIPINIQL